MIIQTHIILLVLLPGLVLSFNHPNYKLVNDARCGIQPPRNRIYGGRAAAIGEYPWMVYIVIDEQLHSNGSTVSSTCGGSIINKNYVLTAAHCLKNDAARLAGLKIFLANCTHTPVSIAYGTRGILIHPNFKSELEGSDIALIRTSRPIIFNAITAPICLEHGELLQQNYAGEMAQVAGWGAHQFADPGRNRCIYPDPDMLQTLTVPILNDPKCLAAILRLVPSEIWGTVEIKSQMCAGGRRDKFIYIGDSGSPLMIAKQVRGDRATRYYQIGVASYVEIASISIPNRTPGIYTRVSWYLKWILDNLRP